MDRKPRNESWTKTAPPPNQTPHRARNSARQPPRRDAPCPYGSPPPPDFFGGMGTLTRNPSSPPNRGKKASATYKPARQPTNHPTAKTRKRKNYWRERRQISRRTPAAPLKRSNGPRPQPRLDKTNKKAEHRECLKAETPATGKASQPELFGSAVSGVIGILGCRGKRTVSIFP